MTKGLWWWIIICGSAFFGLAYFFADNIIEVRKAQQRAIAMDCTNVGGVPTYIDNKLTVLCLRPEAVIRQFPRKEKI